MSHKQVLNKSKEQPPQIFFIQDKKIEKNGDILYLVRYKNSQHSSWASKKYLCTDSANEKCIQRYQILMNADLNISDNEESKGKRQEEHKTKQIKKYNKKPNKANQMRPEQAEYIQIQSQPQSSQNCMQKIGKHSKDSKVTKNKQITFNKKPQTDKIPHTQYQFDIQSQKLLQKDINLTKKFKIIRGKINEGKIDFQIKDQDGQIFWIDGNYLKETYPSQVIRFYEKKITWSC